MITKTMMSSNLKLKKKKIGIFYTNKFLDDIKEFVSFFSFCLDIEKCRLKTDYIKNNIYNFAFFRTLEALVYLYGTRSKYLCYRDYINLIKNKEIADYSIDILKNIQTVTTNFNVLCFGDLHYSTFLYDKRAISKEEVIKLENDYKKIKKLSSSNIEKQKLIEIYDIGSGRYFKIPFDENNHKAILEHIINVAYNRADENLNDKKFFRLTKEETAKMKEMSLMNTKKFTHELNKASNLHIKLLYISMNKTVIISKSIIERNFRINESLYNLYKGINDEVFGKYTKYVKSYLSNNVNYDNEIMKLLLELSTGNKFFSENMIEKNEKFMKIIFEMQTANKERIKNRIERLRLIDEFKDE